MKGYSKTNDPDAGLAAFLASLRKRAGVSIRTIADRTPYKYQAIFQVETRSRWGSIDVAIAHARACGASEDELLEVRVLHALDTGRIIVPTGATEEQVRAAVLNVVG